MVTTEHFTLATARASTIAEANGRAGLFLTAVSMSLVALGFIAGATDLNDAFYVFAFTLLSCLAFVGLTTFHRVVQTGVEDGVLAAAEARARRFYLHAAPALKPWIVMPTEEGRRSRMAVVGSTSRLQILLTAGSMVGVVNSTLIGVLAGMAASRLLERDLTTAAAIGCVAFITSAVGHIWRQAVLWTAVQPRGQGHESPPNG